MHVVAILGGLAEPTNRAFTIASIYSFMLMMYGCIDLHLETVHSPYSFLLCSPRKLGLHWKLRCFRRCDHGLNNFRITQDIKHDKQAERGKMLRGGGLNNTILLLMCCLSLYIYLE